MRSATSVAGRYKRAHLSAIRFEGVPVQDRRCGPLASNPTLETRILSRIGSLVQSPVPELASRSESLSELRDLHRMVLWRRDGQDGPFWVNDLMDPLGLARPVRSSLGANRVIAE
jgi:hypothetical protein